MRFNPLNRNFGLVYLVMKGLEESPHGKLRDEKCNGDSREDENAFSNYTQTIPIVFFFFNVLESSDIIVKLRSESI